MLKKFAPSYQHLNLLTICLMELIQKAKKKMISKKTKNKSQIKIFQKNNKKKRKKRKKKILKMAEMANLS